MLCISMLFLLFSCNTSKHLAPNEYLVSSNKIVDHQKSTVSKDEVAAYIRQKPNRKILFLFPFNLWLYNQINKDKLVKHKEKRDAKFDRINEKRIIKNNAKNEKRIKNGKPPKEPKLKNKDKPTFRESLLEAGEAPVIYDSAVAKQTAMQISKFLFSKGYFYAKVTDSVEYKYKFRKIRKLLGIPSKRKKKLKVIYHLFPGKQ